MAEIGLFGESFTLEAEPNQFALMEFADAAQGLDDDSMAGLAAIFRLVQAAVIAEDWGRFKSLARKNKATVEDLLPVAVSVFEASTGRPTQRPADSSAGPSLVPVSSEDDLSSQVIAKLEQEGRPSFALMVMQAQEARTA